MQHDERLMGQWEWKGEGEGAGRKPVGKKKDVEERLRRHPRREDWRHAECVYVDLEVGLQRRKKERLLKSCKPVLFFLHRHTHRLSQAESAMETCIGIGLGTPGGTSRLGR